MTLFLKPANSRFFGACEDLKDKARNKTVGSASEELIAGSGF